MAEMAAISAMAKGNFVTFVPVGGTGGTGGTGSDGILFVVAAKRAVGDQLSAIGNSKPGTT